MQEMAKRPKLASHALESEPTMSDEQSLQIEELPLDSSGYDADVETVRPDEYEEMDSISEGSATDDSTDDTSDSLEKQLTASMRELYCDLDQKQQNVSQKARAGRKRRSKEISMDNEMLAAGPNSSPFEITELENEQQYGPPLKRQKERAYGKERVYGRSHGRSKSSSLSRKIQSGRCTPQPCVNTPRDEDDSMDLAVKTNGDADANGENAPPVGDEPEKENDVSKDASSVKVAEKETSDDKAEEAVKPKEDTNGHVNGTTEEPKEEKKKETTAESTISGTDKVKPHQEEAKGSTAVKPPVSAVEPEAREDETPSSILEKGIIYFLFRGRVGIDEPKEVNDIARSYMIMRPLPHGAKLGDGPIGDDGNCRLLALPKKVLPLTGKDRFMVFVEKSKTSLKDLKENVLSSSDYETQTAGTRHSPATTPVAEGVYAITTTGRESHLAYIITIPTELGEVQKDLGIREKGSFVTSAKNPQYPGPANASLPKGPDYPNEIIEEFRNLRWMPLQAKLLDYVNSQFLLIGESGGIENALQPQKEDETKDVETPNEEMEKLEGEDEIRVKHLKGDDAVFADLGLSKEEFSSIPSTW